MFANYANNKMQKWNRLKQSMHKLLHLGTKLIIKKNTVKKKSVYCLGYKIKKIVII